MKPLRGTSIPARLAALVTAATVAAAGLSAMSPSAASAAPGPDGSGGVAVDAGHLHVTMDSAGRVTALVDRRTGQNHIKTGQGSAPLVSLMVDGRQVVPSALTLNGSTLVFTGPGGFEVEVAVDDSKPTYSTFTVTKAAAPNGGDLQTLLWGPLATNITRTLGETVGIVRDDNFAVGMKPLTDRTEGGWPREQVNTSVGWQKETMPNPSNVTVAPEEEWSVAARTPWGTLLRAFTFDYTKPRTRMTFHDEVGPYPIPVGTLPNGQGGVVGSKIALFGTAPDLAPTVLSNIATDQNLPYPTTGGQWQKAAQATSKSILVLGGIDPGNIIQAAGHAKSGGMDMVYSLDGPDGPWQSDGHYQFNGRFGNSDSAAAAIVTNVKNNGVQVGAHTLSSFVGWNDPYAAPSFSPDMTVGTSTSLSQGIAAGDTTVTLAGCEPLTKLIQGDLAKIDNEIVGVSSFTQTNGQCQVTGLRRAQWSTPATSHAAGATLTRIPQNAYGGGIGGLPIIKEISTRLATIWNTTGITGMSFDGLEAASQSGWGSYGMSTLVNGMYARQNNRDGFISETSRMGSNIWDGLSRASWGEAFNDMNQLYINNEYYQANYLPAMLGWITLDGNQSVQSLEDVLARAASWNAGSNFRSWMSSLNSGSNTAALFGTIKEWENARNLGAFTPAQRALMRDRSTHWHLSVVTPGKSWSLQRLDGSGNPVGAAQPVVAPTPAFTTTSLPALTAGSLYEARVATNTPQTIRYTVTSGSLPTGLRLNADTGGITGIPTSNEAATFTVTGKGGAGTADAQATFTVNSSTGGTGGPIKGLAGKCVDSSQDPPVGGAKVNLYDCNGGAVQRWTVPGDGSLRVNGKCMDITWAGTTNGTPVQVWDCNGSGAQVWQSRPDGTLFNPASNRCLDVPGWNTANGTQLVIWDCNAGANQKWTLP